VLWNKSRRPMIAPQQAVASDAPLQAANQQVSLISSLLSHRTRGTPRKRATLLQMPPFAASPFSPGFNVFSGEW
jgi:hypothetical protein